MENRKFDPFNDRLSRDIRNSLSASLPDCIKDNDISAAQRVAQQFDKDTLPIYCRQYIEERLRKYQEAIKLIGRSTPDPIHQAIILWDRELFFEVHEILEHAWLKSSGDDKLLLQALIRAAGAYIKIQAGYPEPASSLAGKAIVVLEQHRERLTDYFDPDFLIGSLGNLSAPPPKLGA